MDKKRVWIWFDASSRCNLACSLCYTKKAHKHAHLDPDKLRLMMRKIQSETAVDVQMFHLNWRGEPLLNPDFPELLKIARQEFFGIPSHWHTNGTLLDPEMCRRIIETGVNYKIYVSIDGGNQGSHDNNRGRGTFRRALKGLDTLLNIRNKLGSKIQVGIYQLELGVATSEYDPRFIELTQRVDEWARVLPVDDFGGESNAAGNIKKVGGILPIPNGSCFWAGNALCIDPQGDVYICLLSSNKTGLLGNILDQDLMEIVVNANNFRDNINEHGRASMLHCNTCQKQEGKAFDFDKKPPQVF